MATQTELVHDPPFFSVVIPVRDGAAPLDRTLAALQRSCFRDWELIVVDDASRDGSARVARSRGALVVRSETPLGAAGARNLGARIARGRYLLFLDADCEPHSETLARTAAELEHDGELDAVFGSYDDTPAHPGFASQYKNLFHHHVHQHARERAVTFWTGCGAIRRTTFEELGGFDPGQRMLEDVELGLRLRSAGGRLRLAKRIQVKHLKAWTLAEMIRSDVLDRAVPWARLIAEREGWIDDLNLKTRDRWSAALVGALALSAALAAVEPLWAIAAVPLVTLLTILNRDFYGFLRRRRGRRFALAAIPLHWLYLFYGPLGLAAGLLGVALGPVAREPTSVGRPAVGVPAASRGGRDLLSSAANGGVSTP